MTVVDFGKVHSQGKLNKALGADIVILAESEELFAKLGRKGCLCKLRLIMNRVKERRCIDTRILFLFTLCLKKLGSLNAEIKRFAVSRYVFGICHLLLFEI